MFWIVFMLAIIFINNWILKMILDTNSNRMPAQILTISTADGRFDHYTCKRRYVIMIFTFWYTYASKCAQIPRV